MPINLNKAEFIIAAHKPSQWMEDTGGEVAFAGRSNSGKSSALNAITGHKRLAITSKTPGRTQQIVFFSVTPETRLVDLPGYGYSKVPEKVRRHWARVIEQYFKTRQSLRKLILTMDIRHPLKQLDEQLIDWCMCSSIGIHILLSKADKLSKSRTSAAVSMVEHRLVELKDVSVQAFSSRTGLGVQQAREYVIEELGTVASASESSVNLSNQ